MGFGMIVHAKTDIQNSPSYEVIMSASKVLRFSENFDTMTAPECLTFIERSRRQIGKLEERAVNQKDLDDLAGIRRDLDALERNVRVVPAND